MNALHLSKGLEKPKKKKIQLFQLMTHTSSNLFHVIMTRALSRLADNFAAGLTQIAA